MVLEVFFVLVAIALIIYRAADDKSHNQELSPDLQTQLALEYNCDSVAAMRLDDIWFKEFGESFFPRDGYNNYYEIFETTTTNERRKYMLKQIEKDMKKAGKEFSIEDSVLHKKIC